MKVALITGITGQDGSYLAEFLLGRGDYEVHGIVRRASNFNTQRIDHLLKQAQEEKEGGEDRDRCRFFLHYGDLCDGSGLMRIVQTVQPDEIYNLAAQSHVQVSFECPEYTANVDALGCLKLLEAIRTLGLEKKTRFYQASTSELFGDTSIAPQNEDTPFQPASPYSVAKLFAYEMVRNYRKAYGIMACNGILFNHESPRRGKTFVTRKITQGLCRIQAGQQDCLYLGNLSAKRDWGHAKEYVEVMWRMLQLDEPQDLVIGTGETHTVREFVEESCRVLGIDFEWRGERDSVDEVGVDKKTGRVIVRIDPKYFRKTEVPLLLADPSKARRVLDWEANTKFKELVADMILADRILV